MRMTGSVASQPRIGYVLKRFPRLSETFVLREILALERLGVDVTVFALGRPDEATVHADFAGLRAAIHYVDDLADSGGRGDDRVLADAPETRRESRAVRRLATAVRDSGVTHLHAHFATSAADVARALAALLGLTFSVTAHAKDIFHESVSARHLEALFAEAAFVVTVSEFNVRHLRGAVPGVHRTPIHRIYNGIDVATYRPQQPIVGTSEERILGVGRLVEKKGFDVFIDAIAALRRRRPGIEATIIGTGRCESALKARVEACNLSAHIAMPGAQLQHQVLAAMRHHTVLAVPCVVGADGDRDGLPTVIIEAMALGLPVVATAVTGIPEIVRDGDTGVIVRERDGDALADALDRMLADRALRSKLAVAARRLVESEFDAGRNARALVDLFMSATAPRAVDRPVGTIGIEAGGAL